MKFALCEEGTSPLHRRTSITRMFTPDSQGTLGEAGLALGLSVEALLEWTGKGVFVIHWDEPTPDSKELIWRYSHDLGSGVRIPEPIGQPVVVADHFPAVGTQFDEIVTSISTKLQERLTLFRTGHSDQDAMPVTTMSEVEDLVEWLCSESDLVSATVAADGMLTIAVDFPGDVRLYVEIERDSSAGAAVTRERRYASDIPGETVTDLTPEVILAAVRSI